MASAPGLRLSRWSRPAAHRLLPLLLAAAAAIREDVMHAARGADLRGPAPGRRPIMRLLPGAESDDAAAAPFDVIVTLRDIAETLEHRAMVTQQRESYASDKEFTDKVMSEVVGALPEELEQAGFHCKLKKHPSVGAEGRMTVTITGFDLEQLLTRARSRPVADAILSLEDTLSGLGMSAELDTLRENLSRALRGLLMRRLPQRMTQRLENQQVMASVAVRPAPAAEESHPDQVPYPDTELIYRVHVPSRGPFAQLRDDLSESKLARASREDFAKLVGKGIEAKIHESMGDALEMSVTTTLDDLDSSKEDSFWVRVSIHDVDVVGIFKQVKGEAFVEHYENLVQTLNRLQYYGMHKVRTVSRNLHSKMTEEVTTALTQQLLAKMAKLGASMTAASEEGYQRVAAAAAAGGRCCGAGDEAWWVHEEVARGSGVFGFGFGRSGHCPVVSPEGLCQVKGLSQPKDAVATGRRPFTDCFALLGTPGLKVGEVKREC